MLILLRAVQDFAMLDVYMFISQLSDSQARACRRNSGLACHNTVMYSKTGGGSKTWSNSLSDFGHSSNSTVRTPQHWILLETTYEECRENIWVCGVYGESIRRSEASLSRNRDVMWSHRTRNRSWLCFLSQSKLQRRVIRSLISSKLWHQSCDCRKLNRLHRLVYVMYTLPDIEACERDKIQCYRAKMVNPEDYTWKYNFVSTEQCHWCHSSHSHDSNWDRLRKYRSACFVWDLSVERIRKGRITYTFGIASPSDG